MTNPFDQMQAHALKAHYVMMGQQAFVSNESVQKKEIKLDFNESFKSISSRTGEINTKELRCTAMLTDINTYNIKNNTTLTIGGTDYKVTKREPDGAGEAVLILTRGKCL